MAEEKEAKNTDDIEASIVEYFYERQVSGHRCGYCKSADTFVTNGMWGHRLAGQDYQDLIERGWRRSGKYLYKPIMNRTCCPPYAIRCEALRFKPTRSQRKVARRMRAFLVEGKEPQRASQPKSQETENSSLSMEKEEKTDGASGEEEKETEEKKEVNVEKNSADDPKTDTVSEENKSEAAPKKKEPRPGVGADPNKPRCRKAKELRLERRNKRLAARDAGDGTNVEESDSKQATSTGEGSEAMDTGDKVKDNDTTEKAVEETEKMAAKTKKAVEETEKMAAKTENKEDKEVVDGQPPATEEPKSKIDSEHCPPHMTVEELLELPTDVKLAHRLELKVVDCYPLTQELMSSFIETYLLYKKYQMAVHGDKEEEVSERSFRRFLCDTPLISLDGPMGWDHKYGSFHFQYRIDGKLIMVAVVDILPTYLSSVYVFYDPDYSWLDLGVYSALREIELVRKLHRAKPEFQYYCMGYYIHNNVKMNYKGKYFPSYLLCPDTYRFTPIEVARPQLDKAKYSRFSDESRESERVLSFLGGVLILFEKQVIPYMLFRSYYGHVKDRIVVEYASLVGKALTQRMFLYLLLDGSQQDEDSDD